METTTIQQATETFKVITTIDGTGGVCLGEGWTQLETETWGKAIEMLVYHLEGHGGFIKSNMRPGQKWHSQVGHWLNEEGEICD